MTPKGATRFAQLVLVVITAATFHVTSAVAAEPSGELDPHSGNYGIHALLDTADFPGVTCVYPDAKFNHLKRMRIRAPIEYAFDRTGGSDRQRVGWRYTVQYTDVPDPSESDWQDLSVSSIVKALATDTYNAQWPSRTYVFPDFAQHGRHRVVIKMLWYFPTATTSDGRATHLPQYYAVKDPSGTTPVTQDWCGQTTG